MTPRLYTVYLQLPPLPTTDVPYFRANLAPVLQIEAASPEQAIKLVRLQGVSNPVVEAA